MLGDKDPREVPIEIEELADEAVLDDADREECLYFQNGDEDRPQYCEVNCLRAEMGAAVDELSDGAYPYDDMDEGRVESFCRAGEPGYQPRRGELADDDTRSVELGQRCGTLEGIDQIVHGSSKLLGHRRTSLREPEGTTQSPYDHPTMIIGPRKPNRR